MVCSANEEEEEEEEEDVSNTYTTASDENLVFTLTVFMAYAVNFKNDFFTCTRILTWVSSCECCCAFTFATQTNRPGRFLLSSYLIPSTKVLETVSMDTKFSLT